MNLKAIMEGRRLRRILGAQKALAENKWFRPAFGALLAVLCGLVLWKTPTGEPWVNASYDYLFSFGSRAVTNAVVLIQMDNDAYDEFHQERSSGKVWDRAYHARLLNKLADDGAALVVFDSFFRIPRESESDRALTEAIRRQRCVVLMAEQSDVTVERLDAPDELSVAGAHPTLPDDLFLLAAGTNHWGVAWLDPDRKDFVVRRHWPFPSPAHYPSLPWTAATLAGARLSDEPRERWLRYYGRDGAWTHMSYGPALRQQTNYFHNKIVFIGTEPHTSMPGDELQDEYRTPYTSGTARSSGGVEIMITEFLNLVNGDWLERPAGWIEALVLVLTGASLGGGLGRLRPLRALAIAAAVMLASLLGAVALSYFSGFWFPWLVIAGGQVPFALAWALTMPTIRRVHETITETGHASPSAPPAAAAAKSASPLPETPDYELIDPPFGEGAYGKVWLARNAVGQWQALKVVYLANFDHNADPFDREFNGISRYKPISDKHPGLLRVDFVSRKRPGYFYYVMELGDPLDPGWEREPATYKPRDLVSERARAHGRRLPVRECIGIGLALTDALEFLHRNGLTHRDIKPQNIIFVNGHPKLADVGLTAEIRPPDQERTFVGTPGYMPPPPERPGTPQADLYALGMVLYVLSTGRNAAYFPEISTTLVDSPEPADFFPLNTVILKACHPDPARRYHSAAEMHSSLQQALRALQPEKDGGVVPQNRSRP